MLLASSLAAANSYLVHNLVSDLPNIADHTDSNLVNPWGVAFSGSSPFWIGNNHSGTSTLYDGTGTAIALVVQLPTPAAPTGGAATGTLFNGTQSFTVATGKPAAFMFCTEDGTILGWNSSVDATNAKIMIDNSASHAIYKGCVFGGTTAAPLLFAADFHNGKIDVWDGTLNPVHLANAFQDPTIPSGFAPFNIAVINSNLFVTYAKQDSDKEDDVAGAGNGYVAIYDMAGNLVKHFITQGALNSPWGMVVAPASFGDFAGKLLIGNFGDGKINAYDLTTSAMVGTLNDTSGKPIAIQGLWTLIFGNGGRGGDKGTLYFTAGIPEAPGGELESHGLFGSIQAAPSFLVSGILNAASFTGTIAANTWVSIFGGGLSPTTRGWASTDFVNGALPTKLDNVGVTINGEPAYISYIGPSQINLLVPADLTVGAATIQSTSNGQTSASAQVNISPAAPAFFLFSGTKYIAATHQDNVSLIGPADLIKGATTTPAVPGEVAVLYATGLGATNPAVPNGQLPTDALPLAANPTITIGGTTAEIKFAGLTGAGLYQFNVVVPSGLPAGDAAVVATLSTGAQTQANAFISVAAAP